MKGKKLELNVDFIGGAGVLTKEEEQVISEFLKSRKQKALAKKHSTQFDTGKKAEQANVHP